MTDADTGLTLDTKTDNPPRIIIYADGGIGKSTFAAQSNKPIFLPTEKGLTALNVPKFPIAKTYEEFEGYLTQLVTKKHDYKTLVTDSLDWLEPLIWDKVCRESGVKNIEQAAGGYGKGFSAALDIWRDYLDKLDFLNEERDMTIIQIAHAQVKRYENPETAAYDRINIKLQDGKSTTVAGKLFEWADIVLYASYYVGITKEAKAGHSINKPNERTRAVGSGERILYTQERPAFKAKSRYPLPEQIPFDIDGEYWNVLARHIPYFNKQLTKGE